MNQLRLTHKATHREHGAVLVVSLILLVILTLLGMSVMNTSQLEERMAANVQEVNQSFHGAETGLSWAFNNDDVWDPVTDTPVTVETIPSDIGRSDEIEYAVVHIVDSNPPTGYDVVQFRAAHFDFESIGISASGLETTLHGGGSQVMRRFSE